MWGRLHETNGTSCTCGVGGNNWYPLAQVVPTSVPYKSPPPLLSLSHVLQLEPVSIQLSEHIAITPDTSAMPTGHKFREPERIHTKYEPGPW